jgi:hypothetical protein
MANIQLLRPLGDPFGGGRIILKWILRKRHVYVNWINQSQNIVKWWAVFNALLSVVVPLKVENFLTN